MRTHLICLPFQIHKIKLVNEIEPPEQLSPLSCFSAFSIDIDARSPCHCLIHAGAQQPRGIDKWICEDASCF
jgi:hypothetical protein